MSLAKKLQIKDGQKVRLVHPPRGFRIDAPTTREASADVVLVFVKTKADIEERAGPAVDAAREDHLSCIAYPKAGQLGTDLNRDVLWKLLEGSGVKPTCRLLHSVHILSVCERATGTVGSGARRALHNPPRDRSRRHGDRLPRRGAASSSLGRRQGSQS